MKDNFKSTYVHIFFIKLGPSMWYYNAGEAPTKNILEKHPNLVTRIPKLFGVQSLAKGEVFSKNSSNHIFGNFFEYVGAVQQLSQPIRSLQNSKKFTKMVKIQFNKFFLNTLPLALLDSI